MDEGRLASAVPFEMWLLTGEAGRRGLPKEKLVASVQLEIVSLDGVLRSSSGCANCKFPDLIGTASRRGEMVPDVSNSNEETMVHSKIVLFAAVAVAWL